MYRITRGLTAQQIYNILKEEPGQVEFLDIRNQETAKMRIVGSRFIETSEIPALLEKTKKDKLIILVDEDESQVISTLELFKNQYENLVYLEGGIKSWVKKSYPVKEKVS